MSRFRAVAALCCLLPSACHAEDASAVVSKMTAAYQGLRSYAQTVNVTTTVQPTVARPEGMVSELRYRKPNRLHLVLRVPSAGEAAVWTVVCDGTRLSLYTGRVGRYTQTPAPGSVAGLVKAMRVIGLQAAMDPLYFLQGLPAPAGLRDIRAAGSATVNGARCLRITGKASASGAGASRTREVTLWVDASTYLLRKVQLVDRGVRAMAATPVVRNGRRTIVRRIVSATRTITEVIDEIQVDPPLADTQFTFEPPRGAVRVDRF